MTGRSVVLTGASSGLGEELAIQLAARGDRLALLARRRSELERVADRARASAASAGHTAEVSVFAVDVTEREAVRRILTEIESANNGIDLLILNAGISENLYPERFDDRVAARIFEVNATSAFWAIGAVLPGMVRRARGHIVGVSSIAGYRGLPGASAYSASKAALSTMLESLRVDLFDKGVHVTTVSPGFIRTPLTAKNRHPMPWLVEPDRAAALILRGVDRHRREVRFPWPLTTLMRLLRVMPDWLYDTVARHIDRPESGTSTTDPFAGAE